MNNLDLDAGLAGVVDLVREKHAPIKRALSERESVKTIDFALLHGAVGALLDALDARLPEQQAKAVAA